MSRSAQDIGQAEAYLFAGGLAWLLIEGWQNNGAFALHESLYPPGAATPPHVHDRDDETAYVVSGVLTVETQGKVISLQQGQSKLLERGIPHRLSNHGATETRFLILSAPAGFNDFVRAAGIRVEGPVPATIPAMTEADRSRLAQAMPRFGIHVVDEKVL